MRDTVQPGSLLVIGTDDVPRRESGVGGLEHHITGARILEPFAARGLIHRAEFPLAKRIGDARLEPTPLLLVTDLQPEFDEDDAGVGNDVSLERRAQFQEFMMLLLRTEPHHVFDTRAIIPTAVEDDDLTCRRKVRHVALHVHLRLLTVRRCWQRHEPEDARADAFGDGADGAAFPGAVTALEDDYDAEAFVLHPILEFAQLGLELAQLLVI